MKEYICENCPTHSQPRDINKYPCSGCSNGGAEFPRPDLVNSPPHYTRGGIECIDAIKAALTPEEWRGYCKGNAIKYIWRELYKGGDESLAKCQWYLDELMGVDHVSR
jgi:hypothetical protein